MLNFQIIRMHNNTNSTLRQTIYFQPLPQLIFNPGNINKKVTYTSILTVWATNRIRFVVNFAVSQFYFPKLTPGRLLPGEECLPKIFCTLADAVSLVSASGSQKHSHMRSRTISYTYFLLTMMKVFGFVCIQANYPKPSSKWGSSMKTPHASRSWYISISLSWVGMGSSDAITNRCFSSNSNSLTNFTVRDCHLKIHTILVEIATICSTLVIFWWKSQLCRAGKIRKTVTVISLICYSSNHWN